MNKLAPVIIVVLILLSGSLMYFSNQQSTSQENSVSQQRVMNEKNEEIAAPKKAVLTDRYQEYSSTTFDNSANNRRVLFFFASWCPTCIPADKNFRESVNRIPEDVTVLRVNYNDPETDAEEKALAQKYGITYQHTFVQIDGQGKEITKWNGGQIDELLHNTK